MKKREVLAIRSRRANPHRDDALFFRTARRVRVRSKCTAERSTRRRK